MFTKTMILAQITAPLSKNCAIHLKPNKMLLRNLVDLSHHEQDKIALRAAVLLENLVTLNSGLCATNIEYLIKGYDSVIAVSCKRYYAKIAQYITSPKINPALKQGLLQIDLEPLVDKCVEWALDPALLISVKCFATEALFNIRHRYPCIADELNEQLTAMICNGTLAVQKKGEKLMGYLYPLSFKAYK